MRWVYARYPNGKRAKGWRDEKSEKTCAGCGCTIRAGELYTNHCIWPDQGFRSDPAQGYKPFCTLCFPVKE